MTDVQKTRLEELKAKEQSTLTEEEKAELDNLNSQLGDTGESDADEAGETPAGDADDGEKKDLS